MTIFNGVSILFMSLTKTSFQIWGVSGESLVVICLLRDLHCFTVHPMQTPTESRFGQNPQAL